MKKLIGIFFALTVLLMLTVPALAAQSSAASEEDGNALPMYEADVPVDESTYHEEEPSAYKPVERLPGRGEVADLLQYWEENGYPADASYAFEVGGEVADDGTVYSYWEIGLVDADDARRQEILDLAAPTCLVEFKSAMFTHEEKLAAYEKLTEMAQTDENILEVIFIRNGDTVWVSVPEEVEKEYAEYLIRDCGLGAVVSVANQYSFMDLQTAYKPNIITGIEPGMGTDGGSPISPASAVPGVESGLVPATPAAAAQSSPVFWVCLALAVAVACTLTVLALRRRSAPAAATAQGAVRVCSDARLTRSQTAQAVRDAAEAPNAALYRTILDRAQEDGPTKKQAKDVPFS